MFVHSFVVQPITKKKHLCTFICNSTNHLWWLVELQMNVQTCFFLVIGWITNECTKMFLFGDWLNYKWMYKHVSFWWLVELQMNVQACFFLVIGWFTNVCKKHVCTFIWYFNQSPKRNMCVHSFVIQPITKKKHVCTFICNSTNLQKETTENGNN
jgi:hypothetical protein